MNKIANITINVPHKRAGNVIIHQPVDFDVFGDGDAYRLVPLLDAYALEVANLPHELNFVLQNGKPVSLRGKKDGNLHVMEEAVKLLREKSVLA